MQVVTWVALGASLGLIVGAAARHGRFPGGLVGTGAIGGAGGFLGAAIYTLASAGSASEPDLTSALAGVGGAAILLVILGKLGRPGRVSSDPARR